jgi:PAS domain-containing protein
VSAVVLVIVNGALALAFLGDLHQSSLRADRSLQIMIVLKQVEDLAEASGQSQRRYRLTGDAEQLDAYRKAQMDLPAKLARLRELVTDDSGPFKPLESLTALIDRDRATLAAELTPVAARFSDGRLPQALAVGADRTNAISAAVDAMLQHEQNRLRDHFATIESRAEVQLWTGTLVTSGAIAALAVILAVVFHGARKDRELAAAQSGALEASEQRFRRVFDESPLGILLVENDSQRIVQANPAFCRMLGGDAEQIMGRTIGELMHIDDRELLSDAIRRGTGPDLGIEARYVTHAAAIAWPISA